MKRIRNLDLNKVEAEVEAETDGDKIKSRTEQVAGKLRAVQEELSSLMEQLESTRDSSRKTQGQILEGVKDRIEVNQKVIANSKYPRQYEERKQNVKGLADRYSFLEEENETFQKNYQLLDQTLEHYQKRICQLEKTSEQERIANEAEMVALKKQFAHYKRLEDEQTAKNNQLDKEYRELKELYEHIDEHIASCRDRYAVEESKAHALQQQLAMRVKQFEDRQSHDREVLLNKKKFAGDLQQQLVTVKLASNQVEQKLADLQMKDVEVGYIHP